MGTDAMLLVVDGSPDNAWASTNLDLGTLSHSLLDALNELPWSRVGASFPTGLKCYLATGPDVYGQGTCACETHLIGWGKLHDDDSYSVIKAGDLRRLADHRDIQRDRRYRAAWAYLSELPAETPVVFLAFW